MNMRISLKNNRNLLNKKDYFYTKKEYLTVAKKKGLEIKKLSKEELADIRAEVKRKNKNAQIKKIIALVIAFGLTILILAFISSEVKYMIENSQHSVPDPIRGRVGDSK